MSDVTDVTLAMFAREFAHAGASSTEFADFKLNPAAVMLVSVGPIDPKLRAVLDEILIANGRQAAHINLDTNTFEAWRSMSAQSARR